MTTFILKTDQTFKNLMYFLAHINRFKEWIVEINPYDKKRSNPQNKLYWSWITIIGDELGYTKDELHEEFASNFLGIVQRKTISGKVLIEPVSTTSMNTKEFGEYLNKIEAFAISQNIRLPQPEYYGMET